LINELKNSVEHNENIGIFLKFLNEITEEVTIKCCGIHIVTLYPKFKNWFEHNYPATKIPSNRKFVCEMRKYKIVKDIKINKKTRLGIKNIKLRE